MSIHRATVSWKKEGDFARKKYHRVHTWRFDGGIEVKAAASPSVVPLPWTAADAIDPEEAFVASVSSCHMLTFLFLAANDGFVCESYVDEAEGLLAKNERGQEWVAEVQLRPAIAWSGERQPTDAELDALHHRAHEECFISQSVKSKISVLSERSRGPRAP